MDAEAKGTNSPIQAAPLLCQGSSSSSSTDCKALAASKMLRDAEAKKAQGRTLEIIRRRWKAASESHDKQSRQQQIVGTTRSRRSKHQLRKHDVKEDVCSFDGFPELFACLLVVVGMMCWTIFVLSAIVYGMLYAQNMTFAEAHAGFDWAS